MSAQSCHRSRRPSPSAIDGVVPVARGHELRQRPWRRRRSRARVCGSSSSSRVSSRNCSSSRAEEFAARRVVEGQRGQRIEHAVAAGDAGRRRSRRRVMATQVLRRHAASRARCASSSSRCSRQSCDAGVDALVGRGSARGIPTTASVFSAGRLMASMIFGCGSAPGEQRAESSRVEARAPRPCVLDEGLDVGARRGRSALRASRARRREQRGSSAQRAQ